MQAQPNRKPFSKQEIILGICAIFLLTLACFINKQLIKPKIEIQKQDSAINLNRNVLKFFNIGNKRLIADILWIQTLIEGDEEHYSRPDLNSWMYHRFKSIAIMDPNFYENYIHGGMYLSIVKDDPQGAFEIFELGLAQFPDDYKLNFNAGFNLVFELGLKEKGLFYFKKIINHKNNPQYFPSLINKLEFEVEKNFDAAMLFLENRLNQTKDGMLRKKIKSEIYSLKAEQDLECLNNQRQGCNYYDYNGKPYLKDKNSNWSSEIKTKKYRLNFKGDS